MQGCNIVNNGEYAFYASACNDPATVIDAEDNWWGVADSDSIEAMVYHHADFQNSPTVDYVPFATSPFDFVDPTGILEPTDGNVPSGFALLQNYPNPFNSNTVIEFTLPEPSDVEITVYDILGRPVRQVLSGYHPAGAHVIGFDGTDSRNVPLPSGMYLYRITAGNLTQSRKMVLLK